MEEQKDNPQKRRIFKSKAPILVINIYRTKRQKGRTEIILEQDSHPA